MDSTSLKTGVHIRRAEAAAAAAEASNSSNILLSCGVLCAAAYVSDPISAVGAELRCSRLSLPMARGLHPLAMGSSPDSSAYPHDRLMSRFCRGFLEASVALEDR